MEVNTSCSSCGKPPAPGAKLNGCRRCKKAAYCDRTCQAEHWKNGGHKQACEPQEALGGERIEDSGPLLPAISSSGPAAAENTEPQPASKKKGQGADECAQCLASKGEGGTVLRACRRCGLVKYCSKDCQLAHWKTNHKQFCISSAERKPQQAPSEASAAAGGGSCVICLDSLVPEAQVTLPCSHSFHRQCIAELRKFGVSQVCPLCRVELPPGPQNIVESIALRACAVQRQFGSKNMFEEDKFDRVNLDPKMRKEMVELVKQLEAVLPQCDTKLQGRAFYIIGHFRWMLHDLREAEAAQKVAIAKGNQEARVSMGNILASKGDFYGAIKAYEQCLKSSPNDPTLRYNLATALDEIGETAKAESHLRKALQIEPTNVGATASLGSLLAQQNAPGAETLLRRAVELLPHSGEMHYNLGRFFHGHDIKQAEKHFNDAVRVDPRCYKALNALGAICLQKDDLIGATARFNETLHINPRHVNANMNIGSVYAARGDLAAAEASVLKALKEEPGHDQAQLLLQQVRQARQKT